MSKISEIKSDNEDNIKIDVIKFAIFNSVERESSTKREKEGVNKKYYLTRGIKERRRRGARWSDLFSKDSAQSCQVLRWYEFKNSPLNLERKPCVPPSPPRSPLISSKLAAAIVVVVVPFSKKDRARRRIENNRIFLTSRR